MPTFVDHSIPRGTFLYYTSFQMPETPLTPTDHNFLQGSQVNHNTRDGDIEREIARRNEVS